MKPGKELMYAEALRKPANVDKGKYANNTYYGNNTTDGIHTTHFKQGKKYGGSNAGGASMGGGA